MKTTKKEIDTLDIQADLEAAAAIAYILAAPMMEGELPMSTELYGVAIHGLASFIDRINHDMTDM